jgi:HD-GYP domain-containing protein (c-di-GMP phosphodiesterase class II)
MIDLLPVNDLLVVLSSAGALSMGLPVDHGVRTAVIADRLAAAAAADDANLRGAVVVTALLRWSGCTANATDFALLLGDDVRGRAVLQTDGPGAFSAGQRQQLWRRSPALSAAHCDVAMRLALRLSATDEVVVALAHTFEQWNGEGVPNGVAGRDLPMAHRIASLACDIDIALRNVGAMATRRRLREHAGLRHDPELVAVATAHLDDIVNELANIDAWELFGSIDPNLGLHKTKLPVEEGIDGIADFTDLKLSWTRGLSRRVAERCGAISAAIANSQQAQLAVTGAMLHGLGRVAISNTTWTQPRPLHVSERDDVRLVSFHTERCLASAPSLSGVSQTATRAFERLDGTGSYRGLTGSDLDIPARIVSATIVWEALRSPRPWRGAMSNDEAALVMTAEVASGRLDRKVVEALLDGEGRRAALPRPPHMLSERECEVLQALAGDRTNQQIARHLVISPKTVSRHLENIYRKLHVATRAGATLRAMELGLLDR